MENNSSFSMDVDYYIKRQKNNASARKCNKKKREHEIEIAKEKKELEVIYIKLQKEIKQMQSVPVLIINN